MKKKIIFEEKATFHHEITVEIDGKVGENSLETVLSNYDCPAFNLDLESIAYDLKKGEGIKVISVCQDDSGQSSEIEYFDEEDIEDEE